MVVACVGRGSTDIMIFPASYAILTGVGALLDGVGVICFGH